MTGNEQVKYVSIMIDADEDTGVENETVQCRFLRNGQPVNQLVGHKAVEHAHAGGQCQLSSKVRIAFAFFLEYKKLPNNLVYQDN